MLYVKYTGDTVLALMTEQQLRKELQHVSLPNVITDQDVIPFGYAQLPSIPAPVGMKEDKFNKYEFKVSRVDGQWRRDIILVPVDQDDVEGRYERRCREVRNVRDSKLYDCDWTQGRDVPSTTSDKWIPYRTLLRDITAQPGFPFDVVWPEPPQ